MTFTDIHSRRRRTRDDDPEDGEGLSKGSGDPEGRSTLSTNYGAPGKENPDDPESMGHMAATSDDPKVAAAIRAFDARLSAVEARLGSRTVAGATALDRMSAEARAFRESEAARNRAVMATIAKSNKARGWG
jgi:hypothetical protein